MTIIALQGKSGTGKTECLQKLIYEINRSYPLACIYPNDKSKFNQLIQSGNPVIRNNGNMVDFIVYGTINGKTIAIITYGDNEEALRKSFEELKENNGDCDLCVCACRTQGGTIEFIKNQTLSGKLIVHSRWAVSDKNYREKTMNYQVEEIKSEIEELLK